MATIRIEAAARVEAPAADVYAVLADYRDGHPRILPRQMYGLEVTGGPGVGHGTEIRFRARAPGGERVFRMAVTEPEPGRVLVETDVDSGTVTRFTVEPAGAASHVRIATDLVTPPGLRGVLERAMNRLALPMLFREELRNLERVARERVAE